MNVYLFWYGDEKIKKEIEFKIKKLNAICQEKHKFILGPSKEEHNLLLKKDYYRKACEQKKYAFMSDYYRFWKLKENSGLYIDSLIEINNEKIFSFLEELSKKEKNIFIKEDQYYVTSNWIYRGGNNKVFSILIDRYNSFKYKNNLLNFEYSPLQLTNTLYQENIYVKGYEFFSNNFIEYLPLTFLDPRNKENTFYVKSLASWKDKKIDANKLWIEKMDAYSKKKSLSFFRKIYFYLFYKNRKLLKFISFFIYPSNYKRLKSLD